MNRNKVIKGLEGQLDDLAKYADSDEVLTLTQGQAKAILAMLKEQETVARCKDCAEDIVHCKECRFWKNQGTSVSWLPCIEIQTGGNWFCAFGERRTDNA